MSLLAFALLFALAAPQEQATVAQSSAQAPQQQALQWDFMSRPVPRFSTAQATARQALQQYKLEPTDEQTLRLWQQLHLGGSVDCYALRVYGFKREDGNAPVLVGTTCTPADIYRRKNAGRPPVPKLIPLSY